MKDTNRFVIKENSYTSELFRTIWQKHYHNSKEALHFSFTDRLRFVKKKYFPVYISVGKNLTKGLSYKLTNDSSRDFKNKVFFIYDIPEYVDINESEKNSSLKFHRVRQYCGFMANLRGFSSLEEYMKSRFNSKSRYKFKKNMQRLRSSLNVHDKIYFGDISKEDYELVFKCFYKLQEKKFIKKRLHSHFLEQWNYYYELVYPMILEKKASLYVLYHDKKPICISMHFHTEKIMYLSTTVFDLDYSKFSVGYMSVIKCIDWCIKNNMDAYDFSKGYFHYKTRWANLPYDFYYHIYYDSKSVVSSTLAFLIAKLYQFKHAMRDKGLNTIYNDFLFWLKQRKKPEVFFQPFKIIDNPQFPKQDLLRELNLNEDRYHFLLKPIFDYLFTHSESYEAIKIYEYNNAYWIKGEEHNQKLETIR